MVDEEEVKKSNVCIDIPVDESGTQKTVNLMLLRSWWYDTKSKKHYYLHPEFVHKYKKEEK